MTRKIKFFNRSQQTRFVSCEVKYKKGTKKVCYKLNDGTNRAREHNMNNYWHLIEILKKELI
jgi:hypothetical protein